MYHLFNVICVYYNVFIRDIVRPTAYIGIYDIQQTVKHELDYVYPYTWLQATFQLDLRSVSNM